MKKFNLSPSTLLILTLILITGVACDRTDLIDTSLDEQQIKENFKHWVEGAERGDVEDYFNFITDDFIYLGPGARPISNRDSLRTFLTRFFNNNTFSLPTWETHEIIVGDDLAIHRYSGVAFIKAKNDSTILELDRKYLDVLIKDTKGIWKAHLHSFSTNK